MSNFESTVGTECDDDAEHSEERAVLSCRPGAVDQRKIQHKKQQLDYLMTPAAVQGRKGIRRTLSSRFHLDDGYQPPVFPKTPLQAAFLASALEENLLLCDRSEADKKKFILAMQPQQREAGSTIIKQGDVGDFFYVLAEGTVEFFKDGKYVGTCHPSGTFGELALFYNSPRAASCVAKTAVTVYQLDQRTFRLTLAREADHRRSNLRKLIRGISIFQTLEETTLNRLTQAMTAVRFKRGECIVQKGQQGNVFYIVQEGNVRIHGVGLGPSKSENQILHPGDWFGEDSLLTGGPSAASFTALSPDTVLLAIDRPTFDATIGPLKGLLESEMRKKFLKGLPCLSRSNITETELQQLSVLMEEVSYPKGHLITRVGDPCTMNLWIIRSGKVHVTHSKSNDAYTLQRGDHFGDKSICGQDLKHASSHSVLCEEDVTAWLLARKNVESVIGDITRLGQPKRNNQWGGITGALSYQDFKRHRILGTGIFGTVWLSEHKHTGKVYALKSINKRKIREAKEEEFIEQEKQLISILDHPFIIRLIADFEDQTNFHFLLPFIPGGELFSVLQKEKAGGQGMKNRSAAFYSACVVEALGYLHQRSVAYRDLKLENILINHDGYCVLVDLGFSKIVSGKTYTLVGTTEYLAPEVILSKGHDMAADYWSFGVMCYELLVGVSPFFKVGSSEIDMLKRIVSCNYEIPEFCSEESADLIRKLLVTKEMERLGNLSRGYLDIKSHSWYEESGISFISIIRKETKAPWIPEIQGQMDTSNFEKYSDLEILEAETPTTTGSIGVLLFFVIFWMYWFGGNVMNRFRNLQEQM